MKQIFKNKLLRQPYIIAIYMAIAFCCLLSCKKSKVNTAPANDTFFKIYNSQAHPLNPFYIDGFTHDASGNFYAIYRDSNNHRERLMKTDKNGRFLWCKTANELLEPTFSWLFSYENFLYVSRGYNSGGSGYANVAEVDKFDTSGKLVSTEDITLTDNTAYSVFSYNSLSGDFIQYGYNYIENTLGNRFLPYLRLIDPATGLVWYKNFFVDTTGMGICKQFWYSPAGIVQTADKGFTAAFSFSKIPATKLLDSIFVAFYHFSYDGQLIWQKQIPAGYLWANLYVIGGSAASYYSPSNLVPVSLILDNDSNYVLVLNKQYASVFSPAVSNSIELWKLNQNMEIIDSAEIKIGYTLSTPSFSFTVKDDGSYLLIGQSVAPASFVQPAKYYMIDIDQSLNVHNIQQFAPAATQPTLSFPIATGDGHTAACGTIQNADTTDLFILKMNLDEKY